MHECCTLSKAFVASVENMWFYSPVNVIDHCFVNIGFHSILGHKVISFQSNT